MVIFLYNLYIQKMYRLYRKMTINGHIFLYNLYIQKMVIFLYNLYIFVWIQHSYLYKMVVAPDPSNSFIKRLWCIMSVVSKCVKIYLMETFKQLVSVK